MKTEKSVVFTICQQMLTHSPEASYQRLNPALRDTLANCISAALPFQPDTFKRIYNELRGAWWFGDGAGSAAGEHYYSHAVGCNHALAYQSFENFAGRPGVLWEEDANIPKRLHVGSRFTWKGHYVTVTSLRSDSLIACTYKDARARVSGIKVGATISDYSARENKHYVITASKRDGTATVLRVVPAEARHGDSLVARRFTIGYEEIAEFRRSEKARVKEILVLISKCNPQKDQAKLSKRISGEHFRHFQLEIIRGAFTARIKALAAEAAKVKEEAEKRRREEERREWLANKPAQIEKWRNGANGAWLAVEETLLRVKGDQVECSNGNAVSAGAARSVLPVLLDQRSLRTATNLNLPLDGHTVTHIGPEGVQIGCTLIPWSEIDYVATKLTPNP